MAFPKTTPLFMIIDVTGSHVCISFACRSELIELGLGDVSWYETYPEICQPSDNLLYNLYYSL